MAPKHIPTVLTLALVLASPICAHATAIASASASVDWSSLSLVFTPDSGDTPGDSYLTWSAEDNYSAAAVDLATWYWPDPSSDMYFEDWVGVDPVLDASLAGNGWEAGNVSGDLGNATGEGHTIPGLGASGSVNVVIGDTFAGSTAAAVQGGYFMTSEAGWLEVTLDYTLNLSLSSTDDGLAFGTAYAEFFVYNASDPLGDEDGDFFELYAYAFNETRGPDTVVGAWTGLIYLGAGDQAHLKAYTDVYMEADSLPAPPVPEPASLGLLAMGLVGLMLRRRVWRG